MSAFGIVRDARSIDPLCCFASDLGFRGVESSGDIDVDDPWNI